VNLAAHGYGKDDRFKGNVLAAQGYGRSTILGQFKTFVVDAMLVFRETADVTVGAVFKATIRAGVTVDAFLAAGPLYTQVKGFVLFINRTPSPDLFIVQQVNVTARVTLFRSLVQFLRRTLKFDWEL
jgi:hypothetical protein